jgi:hypothetical protein
VKKYIREEIKTENKRPRKVPSINAMNKKFAGLFQPQQKLIMYVEKISASSAERRHSYQARRSNRSRKRIGHRIVSFFVRSQRGLSELHGICVKGGQRGICE